MSHTDATAETVEREGPIFEFGDYPDKNFSLTAEEFRAANPDGATGAPIDLQHFRQAHPLTGKLGRIVKTWVQGNTLFAKASWPKALDTLLGEDRKVSCHFTPDKKLQQLDLVVNPRIKSAFLFGEIGDSDVETEAAPGVEGPVVEFDAMPKREEHSRLVAQDMHDIAVSAYPGLCYGGSMFASDTTAKRHMALIHRKSINHGATCNRLFHEEAEMADHDKNETKPETDHSATFADLNKQIEALKAENRKTNEKMILKDAAVFAEDLIRPGKDQRAIPAERDAIIRGYAAAAMDDMASPRAVTFSVGDGETAITFSTSRLADFKALHQGRKPLTLGVAHTINGNPGDPGNLPEGYHAFSADERTPADMRPLTDDDKKRLDERIKANG